MIASTVYPADDERLRTYQKHDLWVVYSSPADYPGRSVARRWKRGGHSTFWNSYIELEPTTDRHIADSIAELRRLIKGGRGCFPPPAGADAVIAEVWI